MAKSRATRMFRRILHPSDFSPAARPAFRKAVELAKANGAELVITHVLPTLPLMPDTYIGMPADSIARLAKSRRADVIVIGTHGRTGFQRALMGSVAARVIALARCPVLTVRA